MIIEYFIRVVLLLIPVKVLINLSVCFKAFEGNGGIGKSPLSHNYVVFHPKN